MDPYAEANEPPPPRRGSGCLWGCLGLFLAVLLVVGGLFGFGAWYFYKGFENDARLQGIMAVVRHDPRAEAVLGRNIRILEVESRTSFISNWRAHTATYTLHVTGSSGDGQLTVSLDLSGGGSRITQMILTGPDGRPHYLVGKEPKNPLLQSI